MPDEFWLISALVSAIFGMAWLALAMEVHWKQACAVATRSKRGASILRCLGIAALTNSLVLCLLADTATMAVLVWMMLLALSAAGVALLLSWRPGVLAPLALRSSASRNQ